jgi:hypothetical protein
MKRTTLFASAIAATVLVAALALGFAVTRDSASAQRGNDNTRDDETFHVITRDDNGQTVIMHAGDMFVLRLGDEWDWNVTLDDPDLFQAVPTLVRDGQGTYLAVKAGEAAIHGSGGLHCDPGEVCPMIAAVFSVHVVVR